MSGVRSGAEVTVLRLHRRDVSSLFVLRPKKLLFCYRSRQCASGAPRSEAAAIGCRSGRPAPIRAASRPRCWCPGWKPPVHIRARSWWRPDRRPRPHLQAQRAASGAGADFCSRGFSTARSARCDAPNGTVSLARPGRSTSSTRKSGTSSGRSRTQSRPSSAQQRSGPAVAAGRSRRAKAASRSGSGCWAG